MASGTPRTVGKILRSARSHAGQGQAALASAPDVARSVPRVSSWERDHAVPPADVLERIGALLGQSEWVRDAVNAVRIFDMLPPDREWVFHPRRGRMWAWVLGPSGGTLNARWGPWRIDLTLPDIQPEGILVTSLVSRPDPPLFVELSEPGWVVVGTGPPPPWLELTSISAWPHIRACDEPNLTVHRIAKLIVSPDRGPGLRHRILRHIIDPVTLESIERHVYMTPTIEPLSIPAGIETMPDTVDIPLLERACRTRRASDPHHPAEREPLPLDRIVAEASNLPGIGDDALTRAQLRHLLETGHFGDPYVPAQLDVLFGLDGRLFAAPLNGRKGNVRKPKIPPFWHGPIWCKFEPGSDPEPHVMISAGPYSKALVLEGPCVVTTRVGEFLPEPFDINAPGWFTTVGLGRYPGAFDINELWVIEDSFLSTLIDDGLRSLVQLVRDRRAG